jgi:hypothetical protein
MDQSKTVRFDDKVVIHQMITWKFAYNDARKGGWATIVADRYRFMRRCLDVERKISYVFTKEHRDKIRKNR